MDDYGAVPLIEGFNGKDPGILEPSVGSVGRWIL
jgi:hypothetical protein